MTRKQSLPTRLDLIPKPLGIDAYNWYVFNVWAIIKKDKACTKVSPTDKQLERHFMLDPSATNKGGNVISPPSNVTKMMFSF